MPVGGVIFGQLVKDGLQGRAGYVLHAQQPRAAVEGRLRKDLHDVFVLEPGHLAAFAANHGNMAPACRDLQGNLTVQGELAGKINGAERPAAQ